MTRPTQRRHAGLPAVLRRNQPEQHAGQRPGQGPDATGGAGWSGLHAFKSTAVPLMPPSAGPRPGPCWSNSWFDQFGGLYLNAGSGRGRPCCRLGLVIGVGRMAAFDRGCVKTPGRGAADGDVASLSNQRCGKRTRCSGCDGPHHALGAHDLDHPLQVVGQYRQADLRSDLR